MNSMLQLPVYKLVLEADAQNVFVVCFIYNCQFT